MQAIDATTVVVFSSDELKTVLEGNVYNYIYFGQNITLKTGITISKSKSTVTIDGTYNGVKYTFEDMNSSDSGYTISVRNKEIAKVTVQNINVIGHNYYGIIYVPEDTSLKDVVVEYNNLIYNGPQITYHPTGLSVYIDCDITINTSYNTANEVAECNRIEIGGKTTILHNSTGDSMFWFRGTTKPYFKILSNANVSLTSKYRELFYGVTTLDFSVLENANFSLTSYIGMGYNNYATNNVLIDKNASVVIRQTNRNGSYPTWFSNGPFIMNENSSLHMYTDFTDGTTTNYNLYLISNTASLTLNNPKEVVFYNNKANAIYTNVLIPFSLTYSRLNMWTKAAPISSAGSLDDIPDYSWYKENELSTITGNFNSSATTIISNNYTADELKDLPSLTNLAFQGKPVLSIGKMLLCINALSEKDTIISGYTENNAEVKITYSGNSDIVTANENGIFQNVLSSPLPIGTNIKFLANVRNSFIYQSKVIQIVYAGELILNDAPKTIEFSVIPFSTNPVLCPRKNNTIITITDSRINSSEWKLYASINHNLISKNNYVLTDSLVFINDDIVVLNSEPTLIYTGQNNNGTTKITNVSWPENKGILLRVANEPLENGEEYSANITWTLDE